MVMQVERAESRNGDSLDDDLSACSDRTYGSVVVATMSQYSDVRTSMASESKCTAIVDFAELCGRGLAALTRLALSKTTQFARDARGLALNSGVGECDSSTRFPTATAHALLALLDVGARPQLGFAPHHTGYKLEHPTKSLISTEGAADIPHYIQFLSCFLTSRFNGSRVADPPHHLNTNCGEANRREDIYKEINQVRFSFAESPYSKLYEHETELSLAPYGWLVALGSHSTHCEPRSSDIRDMSQPTLDPRELIYLGHIVPAALFLAREIAGSITRTGIERSAIERLRVAGPDAPQRLIGGAIWAIQRIDAILRDSSDHLDFERSMHRLRLEDHYADHADDAENGITCYLALNAAFALDAATCLIRWFTANDNLKQKGTEQIPNVVNSASALARELLLYFRRVVNRMMARASIDDDPSFDVVALIVAMRGASLLDSSYRQHPLFREGIRVAASRQLADGCWPNGVSTSAPITGHFIQQPSTEIAMYLAATVFRREMYYHPTRVDVELAELAMPALQRHARFLEITWIPADQNAHNYNCPGWASDRVRRDDLPETWITALGTRFLHLSSLVYGALGRHETLRKYGYVVSSGAIKTDQASLTPEDVDKWHDSITDPDSTTRPLTWIRDEILKPLANKAQDGRYLVRPVPRGVSFILFGPPASGKTFLLKMIAKDTGWPLLELTPSQFIESGSEALEATAARIFTDLMYLEHAIVLLDECDEFFRDRSPSRNYPSLRNLMSFLTASMLPKIQRLHDQRRIIFCVATNYLTNIDSAIRRIGRFDAVLLYDRPDSVARETFIKKIWAKHNHPEVNVPYLAEIVKQSNGASFKELLEFMDEFVRSERTTQDLNRCIKRHFVSISDYVAWASCDGIIDLWTASGAIFPNGNELKQAVIKRWETLPGYKVRDHSDSSLKASECYNLILGKKPAQKKPGSDKPIVEDKPHRTRKSQAEAL